ncbi:MAG TPA: DUF2330 domain-containing protein [Polyangiaceae bacterium]|nr:DUF2330 domain-containing protein [Polyangiaceae bacterium]
MSTLVPATAQACGGFFCNRAQPVNQAAESIIFADNGDGTTTAVIQIQYQGPAQNFSWLLPISSVPKSDADIGVASNLALQRLQTATNPNYVLTTRVEGECREADSGGSGCGAAQASGRSFNAAAPQVAGEPSNTGVVVEATGVVGAFQWSVISLDPSLSDPASAAAQWLKDNGYDVPSSAPGLLGPYLKQGLYLLALRLTKGADSGSIRPIVLTYAGAPSIPVKLTAVAANDDMGVLTWVLGKSRAVPTNYLSLELNEARINWFSAATNYNFVVSQAANDAGGQGFVTEFSGATGSLATVWTTSDESKWIALNEVANFVSDESLVQQAQGSFGAWDGFWDATRAAAKLPSGVTFDAFKACPSCYSIQLSPAEYIPQLEKLVIEPVRRVQQLIDAHPQITRLYTTLSADEMTLDPLFGFNAALPAVSNQHQAERVVACNPAVDVSDAPWHVDLPQGGSVWGSGSVWPSELATLPPNRVITRTAESGEGKVIEDNSAAIQSGLTRLNSGKEASPDAGGGCATGRARSRGAWLSVAALAAALLVRRRLVRRRDSGSPRPRSHT